MRSDQSDITIIYALRNNRAGPIDNLLNGLRITIPITLDEADDLLIRRLFNNDFTRIFDTRCNQPTFITRQAFNWP